MNLNGEKLRQAKSFDELKAGMITVTRGCEVCDRPWCRGILVSLIIDWRGPAWMVLPICDGGQADVGICEEAVTSGDVFIVEDGLGKVMEKQKETHDVRR